ncbi:hypothetical protein [Amphibiibacter pelophylacis]|uniref:Uncharacterized protein n=1 Tax=Amphibiibacter pelophylacis TaxID=1799477 RepID=A0ACC6NYB2_9BURK
MRRTALALLKALAAFAVAVSVAASFATSVAAAAPTAQPPDPAAQLQRLALPGGAGDLPFYVAAVPAQTIPQTAAVPVQAFIAVHGYPRDAQATLRIVQAAVAKAAQAAGGKPPLIVAPIFPVTAQDAPRCRTPGEPEALSGDAQWRCGGWLAGSRSLGGIPPSHGISSLAALDALVAHLARQWPSLRRITLVGFSGGAQLLQRHAALAAQAPDGVTLRWVIASPGSWLYFDAWRPDLGHVSGQVSGDDAACPRFNHWKYGLEGLPGLPDHLAGRDPRDQYRHASIAYLAGSLDSGPGPGTADARLDHGCEAQRQGPYRLQRAQGYQAYTRQVLRPLTPQPLTVVPGCAHSAACVLGSDQAKSVLFAADPPH